MLRIRSLRQDGFRHGGLEVAGRWSEFPENPTTRQRACLRDYHGRFIAVHPQDLGELGKIGLRFSDEHEPLVDLTAKASAAAAPPAAAPPRPTRNDPPKSAAPNAPPRPTRNEER